MSRHGIKQRFAVKLAVDEILRTAATPVFATLTFKENVTDRGEAEKAWRRLKARIQRKLPDFRCVGTWQRQGRGAWHLHFVADRPLDVLWLRPAAVACGWGQQMTLDYINRNGYRAKARDRVADYITRYIVRDTDERGDDWKVRLPVFCGPRARVSTCRFGWAAGFSRLFRLGMPLWYEFNGGSQARANGVRPTFEGYWVVVRMGWESLDAFEKERLLLTSDAINRWWSPERHPF